MQKSDEQRRIWIVIGLRQNILCVFALWICLMDWWLITGLVCKVIEFKVTYQMQHFLIIFIGYVQPGFYSFFWKRKDINTFVLFSRKCPYFLNLKELHLFQYSEKIMFVFKSNESLFYPCSIRTNKYEMGFNMPWGRLK